MIDLNKVEIIGTFGKRNLLNDSRIACHYVVYAAGTEEAVSEEFSFEHPHTMLTALKHIQQSINKTHEIK